MKGASITHHLSAKWCTRLPTMGPSRLTATSVQPMRELRVRSSLFCSQSATSAKSAMRALL